MAAFNLSLPKVQIEVDRAWRDPILKQAYVGKVGAARAILDRQTTTFASPIQGTGKNAKNLTTTIYWPLSCPGDVVSCSDECVVSTAEPTDNSQDVVLACLAQIGFKESMKRFRDSPLDFDRVVATSLMANMKVLDEYIAKQTILFIEANKGVHTYEIPGGTIAGGDMELPGSAFTADLMTQLMLSAEFSRLTSPFVLDGTNFYADYKKVQAFVGNLDGKGNAQLYGDFPFEFDPINMTSTAPNKTYLLNGSAVAFISGNFWDLTRTEMAPGHFVYKIQSQNLPGIYYDVHEIQACSSNDFVTSWQLRLYGSFELNPLGCDTDNTGILAFENMGGI